MRILIVEDHALTRLTLRRLLERDPSFTVAGVADDMATAATTAAECEPDIALVDYQMPDGNGVSVTKRLLRDDPQCIIVGMSSDNERCDAFLNAGATAFFHKRQGFRALPHVLHVAADQNAP